MGKQKQDSYNNLEYESVTDNKTFWKSIKPPFSKKSSTHNNVMLAEHDLILDKNENAAEVLNIFLSM